uniref:Ionotropic receptor n=1 Tax=Protaetia brevitarsis TaxID=348688 RepID=A0A411HR94_PROBE|nr:ionotropic receptor [Protaetia brevitarsis]
MNIFTIFAFIICSFNLIYTLSVNLGIIHSQDVDPLNPTVLKRVDRYYMRQGKSPQVDFIETIVTDILSANSTLCELTAEGIIGLIGPTYQTLAPILQSICANLEIPYVEYTWKPSGEPQNMTINFFPESNLMAKGFAALVASMNWKSFTVLYETTESLAKLRDVLKINVPRELPMIFKQIHPDEDYRVVFKQIKNYTENTIIIDCELDRVIPILQQAKEVGMLEYHNKYFLANLDAHTLDFSDLSTTANITTISLLNTTLPILRHATKDWSDGRKSRIKPEEVKVEQAILHDAAYFFMRRYYELRVVDREVGFTPESLLCDKKNILQHGFRMYHYMLSKSEELGESLTAPIRFDASGRRIDFNLYGVEIIEGKKEVIVDWNPSMGDEVNFRRNFTQQLQAAVENLRKVKVIVAARLGAPYVLKKTSENGDNATVEGFAYDLIKEIADDMNFTFEFKLYDEYGKYNPATKTWNGLIKALLDRSAHLAICDLTITEARRSVVDFTLPFMNLDICRRQHLASKTQRCR